MATMCHFWRLTPADYWALTVEEHAALVRHMEQVRKEQERTRHGGQ